MLVLVAVTGCVVWLSVLGFFLALCRASGLADEQAAARVRRRRARRPSERPTAQIFDLRAARANRLIRAR
jgi:hypothetical protein